MVVAEMANSHLSVKMAMLYMIFHASAPPTSEIDYQPVSSLTTAIRLYDEVSASTQPSPCRCKACDIIAALGKTRLDQSPRPPIELVVIFAASGSYPHTMIMVCRQAANFSSRQHLSRPLLPMNTSAQGFSKLWCVFRNWSYSTTRVSDKYRKYVQTGMTSRGQPGPAPECLLGCSQTC